MDISRATQGSAGALGRPGSETGCGGRSAGHVSDVKLLRAGVGFSSERSGSLAIWLWVKTNGIILG